MGLPPPVTWLAMEEWMERGAWGPLSLAALPGQHRCPVPWHAPLGTYTLTLVPGCKILEAIEN